MWNVEYTDEFEAWWDSLDENEQDEVAKVVTLLESEGPHLPFPFSSQIKGSENNLRELRIQYKGNPYRTLYAFDPHRSAILLLGGNKTGNDRWYEENVPRADKIFNKYLKEIETEKKPKKKK